MSLSNTSKRLGPGGVLDAGRFGALDPDRFLSGGSGMPRLSSPGSSEGWSQGGPIGGIDGTSRGGLMDGLYKAGANSNLADPKNMAMMAGMQVTAPAELITMQVTGMPAHVEEMRAGIDPNRWKIIFAARLHQPLSQDPAALMFCMLSKTNRMLETAWTKFQNDLYLYSSKAMAAEPHPNSLAAMSGLGKRALYDSSASGNSAYTGGLPGSQHTHFVNRGAETTYNARFLEEFASKFTYLGVSIAGSRSDAPESLQHSVRQIMQIMKQGRVTHLKDIFGETRHGDRLYLAVLRPNTGTDVNALDIMQMPPLKIVPVVMRDGAGLVYNSPMEPLLGYYESLHESNLDRRAMGAGQDPLLTPHQPHVGLGVNAVYGDSHALFYGSRCGISADQQVSDVFSPDLSFIDVRLVTPHHCSAKDPTNGALLCRGDESSAGNFSKAYFKGEQPLVVKVLATALTYYVGFVENTEVGEAGTTPLNRHNALTNAYEENLLRGEVSVFVEA